MAINNFNAKNGLSVGSNPINVVDNTANATFATAMTTGSMGVGSPVVATARLFVSGTSTSSDTTLAIRAGVPAPSGRLLDIRNNSGTSVASVDYLGNIFGVSGSFSGDVSITGNLTVAGTQTIINSDVVNIKDNIVLLNVGPSPASTGGIYVADTVANTTGSLIWDSTTDQWKVGRPGTEIALISGSGTNNYVTKWVGSNAVGNSIVFEDGTNVGIGTTLLDSKFVVAGNVVVSGSVNPSADNNTSYFLGTTSKRWANVVATSFSGSLTKLSDGTTNYLQAGSNITIATGSNGSVTIATTGLASTTAQYLTLAADASLSSERVFTPGVGLKSTDGGAGGNYTLSINDSVVATVSGTTFTGITNHNAGLSGSLTRLTDGTSYLIAGAGITIATGSNGSVTITGNVGDITNVTAGNGLLGGGTSGDVSLSINNSVVATISGSTFTGAVKFNSGLSGSLTQLVDGTSYLVAGSNIQINTGSNGSVNISSPNAATNSSAYITVGNDSTLTNERALSAGTGLKSTDSGANGTFTLSINDSVVATISGTTFTGVTSHNAGLSGSLTKLTDGTSYLVAGSNVQIQTGSNGSVTITATASGASYVAGSNTQVQFNDGGTFGADADFTFDKNNNLLKATNISGSLTGSNVLAGQVVVAGTGGVLSGSNNFWWSNSTNNVGIGTTNPGYKLTIAGTGGVFATDNNASFVAKNTSGTYESWVYPRQSDGLMYIDYAASGLRVRNSTGAVTTLAADNSGNVGLGTATPSQKLHIYNGHAYFENGYGIKSGGEILLEGNGTNTNIKVTTLSSAGTYPNAKVLYVTNPSSELFTILNSGNVGVGNASPGDKLSVNGSMSVTGSLLPGTDNLYNLGSSTKRWATVFATSVSGSLTGSNVLAGQVVVAGTGGVLSGSNNFVWDNANGRVGIGTATVSSKLHVYGGDIVLQDAAVNTDSTMLKGYSVANGGFWVINNPSNAAGAKLTLGTSFSWDQQVSLLYSPGTVGAAAGILSIGQQDKNSANWTHGVTSFYTNGTERLRIDPSGNVGIGTTNPNGNRLAISGGNLSVTGSILPGVTTTYDLGSTTYRWQDIYARTGSFSGDVTITGDLTVNGTQFIVNTQVVEIEDNAILLNAGPSPASTGGIYVADTTTGVTGSLLWDSVTDRWKAGKLGSEVSLISGSGANNYVAKWSGANAVGSSIIYDDGTNVGVGTTPANKFHIFGSSNDTVSRVNSNLTVEGGGGNGLVFGTYSTLRFASYIQSGFVSNFGTATYVLSLNPLGGNVGIGTSTTTDSLAVNGSMSVTGSLLPGTDVAYALGNTTKRWSNVVSNALTGSLTKLSDGTTDYLQAGSNIAITTGSNGAVTISTIGLASTTAQYLTLTADASLTSERVFTPSTGLKATDGGAGGSYTLTINDSVVATVSGTTFTGVTKHNAGLSGSLTKLTDGTSYLIAGAGITIATGSNGSVTITGNLGDITSVTAGNGLLGGGTSGDVSLSINDSIVATVSGTTFTGVTKHNAGLSGSLTRLTDGTSYIVAGSNITAITGSNGSITLAATGLAPISSAFLTVGNDSTLTNERSLSTGTGLLVADGGANSTYTISINDSIVATVSGTTFTGVTNHNAGLSGSLTKLTNGTSYLIAGSNIQIATGSTGAVTITSTATGATYVAGSTTQVQFNDGGTFGADADFTFDKSSNLLRATNISGSLTGSNVAAGQVIVAGIGGVISGSNNFWWDDANSRVGIGTTSFTSRLHVSGSSTSANATATLRAGVALPSAGILDVQTSTGTSIFDIYETVVETTIPIRGGNGSATAPTFSFTGGTTTGMYRRTTGQLLSFTVSGNQAFGIDTNGNFGINVAATSAPSGRLHVQGDAAAGSTNTLLVRHGAANGANLPVLDVQNSVNTSLLFVSGSGNVGIGTNNPSGVLEARQTNNAGRTNVTFINPASASTSNRMRLRIAASAGYNGTDLHPYMEAYEENAANAANGLAFGTYNGGALGERMRIDASGNVGIGTVVFTDKLAVNGSMSVTGSLLPGVDDVYDLGASTKRWSNVYADNVIASGSLGPAYTSPSSTSGTTALFDTISISTDAAVYELMIIGNPNSSASAAYRDVIYGKVIIGTGNNGAAVRNYIQFITESPAPRSLYGAAGNGPLTADVVYLQTGSEFTDIAQGGTATIRVKIAGYAAGFVGNNTTVRLKQLA